MPVFVDNPLVDDLVKQLQAITGKKKVDVVREALEEAVARHRAKPSLLESVRALQAQAKADGFKRLPDEKEFLDDLSGGI
ncbi:type II toxin-antitoxin system VapB family antitoxin [Paracoccus sp. TOH]|uniref:type II toxin-antitoxin system VapB family antitoxin n=1 Tax=Paracoccus sp. TOH TaxID=1263728 RepID=UPI0025B195B7|nr:type II toxin-antitoxin system VapB family antitoxin [Paracoccus sp. TOH]WJS87273.1 type II toxin-antitoxin system VapB family antitoxin [Paracoccus sp. TOH]